MTPLTLQERRALAFIAGLVFLSAVARVLDRPRPLANDLPAVDVAALEAASRKALEKPAARPLRPGERIDPNSASVDELMRLPRMRRATAEKIVETRASNRYRSLADLDRLPGVGPATLAQWREWVTLPDGAPAREQPAARTAPRAGAPSGRAPAAQSKSATPLDLNRASAAELEKLPGIGPALAKRIVAYRDSVGRFERVDQLEAVKGIGPAMLARLRTLVTTGS